MVSVAKIYVGKNSCERPCERATATAKEPHGNSNISIVAPVELSEPIVMFVLSEAVVLFVLSEQGQSHPQSNSVHPIAEYESVHGALNMLGTQLPVTVHRASGRVPDSRALPSTSKWYRELCSGSSVAGTVPVKELFPSANLPRAVSLPNSLGIGPV